MQVDDIFFCIGLAVVCVYTLTHTLSLLGSLLASLSRPSLRSYGKWAVVTGATDGIGKAYAKQLAQKGFNVVIVSRSQEKLAEVASEIRSKAPGVEVRTLVADFSVYANDETYNRIADELYQLDIGILVNNVGTSYPSALYFHELGQYDSGLVNRMINLNVVSVTKMTEIVLPNMIRNKRGAIINIASAAGRIPIGNPMYAEYSASKAYVDFFSRSLHYELKRFGIHVQCQSPYFVTTKMSKIRNASLGTPTPDGFVRSALAAIGGDASVVPYWAHAIQDSILQAMPASLLSTYLNWLHRGIRSAYLKKLQKQAAASTSSDAAPAPAATRDSKKRRD